jgi:GTP cyclohydrolase I
MSRLFLQTQEMLSTQLLSFKLMGDILIEFLESHKGISKSAFINIQFDYMTKRKALKSKYEGWRAYPVTMMVRLENGKFKYVLGTDILYSSTCPCSSALARQLIQKQFLDDFSANQLNKEEVLEWLGTSQGIVATPHSQRSVAQVRVCVEDDSAMAFDELIDLIEDALKTPVQAAVKREDEQEFALLNGQNLMFCEDAARRIKHQFELNAKIKDYWARVEHHESLHPHEAVSVITKGVPGGFNPDFHF